MITQQEINSINTTYFETLQASSFAIYIRSNCTGHSWGLLIQEYPTFRNFRVYHRHRDNQPYHQHRDAKSIAVAVERIKAHDTFQLSGRKPAPVTL
jgi:hypothetical protein